MEPNSFDYYIQLFEPVVKGMQALIGPDSEFILHDLSKPENSIVAVAGDITGRKPGAPVTNVVLEALAKYGDEAPDMIGYSSVSKDGRPLKSSTIFIRDPQGHIVGCMCSNMDLTDYLVAQKLMEQLCSYGSGNQQRSQEVFAQDIREVTEEIVRSTIAAAGTPVPMMTRSEKLQLMRELERKRVFEVKGSVEYAAHSLGVSLFTVYSYLKEIRSEKTA